MGTTFNLPIQKQKSGTLINFDDNSQLFEVMGSKTDFKNMHKRFW